MANIDQRFEEFRRDFVAHLSARFGLAPDVVAGRLGEWLVDRGHDDTPWQQEVPPSHRRKLPR
jgi:hypothetical protein